MNITMTEARLRPDSTIDLLELVSMEGCHYMARYYSGDEPYILVGKDNHPVWFNGACEAREAFRGFHVKESVIIPPAGTDEMIGMSLDDMPEMRVRL